MPRERGMVVHTMTANDQRNRAATLRVDFRIRRIRRSGSRICYQGN
ncbi:MAG: hypothetical protein AAF215_34005 [Cyanobacteria bacterium P01_A01_bin.123]